VIDLARLPLTTVKWESAVRIIRSIYPPIDLFEDISDPADWPLLISAEQKTNPRLMENIGNLELVPEGRRVGGSGATYLVAPFCHISPDRRSRFSDRSFGVFYAGNLFEVALLETVHHHERFMARTNEAAGWTSQFREIIIGIDARLHDLRKPDADQLQALDPLVNVLPCFTPTLQHTQFKAATLIITGMAHGSIFIAIPAMDMFSGLSQIKRVSRQHRV
jgi:hypothetical protein